MTWGQSMNGDRRLRVWALLLILSGLSGLGSTGARALAAPSTEGRHTVAATTGALLSSVDPQGNGSEAIVDPLEGGDKYASIQLLSPRPAPPGAFMPLRSRRAVPVPTPLVESGVARAPPSA